MPPRRRSRAGGALRSVAPESRGSAVAARGAALRSAEPARVLVDGRNVQHALSRASGSSLPPAALVAQLRAAFPAGVQVELILDGHPSRGPQGRVAPGLAVVFSKGATADEVIGNRVSEAFRALGPVDAWSVLVITDDREVRDHARRNGIRVEGTAWLGDRIQGAVRGGGAGTGVGNARGPAVRNARGEPKG